MAPTYLIWTSENCSTVAAPVAPKDFIQSPHFFQRCRVWSQRKRLVRDLDWLRLSGFKRFHGFFSPGFKVSKHTLMQISRRGLFDASARTLQGKVLRLDDHKRVVGFRRSHSDKPGEACGSKSVMK